MRTRLQELGDVTVVWHDVSQAKALGKMRPSCDADSSANDEGGETDEGRCDEARVSERSTSMSQRGKTHIDWDLEDVLKAKESIDRRRAAQRRPQVGWRLQLEACILLRGHD